MSKCFIDLPSRFGLWVIVFCMLSAVSFAQNITGKVTGLSDGQPLPGVSIVGKGSTNGTVTDAEGKYSLNVGEGTAALIFSFIGFVTEEVPIQGKTNIDVALTSDLMGLQEVVVTALGIKKERKALAYSVTEVKGKEFTQARETNLANALSGKIAGVNVSGMSTGAGGSSRVIIRGNGSLNGNNQPLYVINGMPIDNSVPGGSATTNEGGLNVDRGDGISGINPDDIESISVLKGGTAAALYGSRASNGVILITTKKGTAQKGIGVTYNTTFTLEDPAVIPDFQYEYGQGDGGLKPTTQAQAIGWGRRSWGPRMDGQPYIGFDGKERPYSPQKDNIRNFYNTGSTFSNTIAFNGGSEELNFRFSLADINNKSVLPNSSFNRKVANLNLNTKLGKRITIETVGQYNLEKGTNRASAGDAPGNPNWTAYMIANTVDIRDLDPGYDENGREIQWNETPYASNSYFVVNKFKNNDAKNRFIGQANIKFNILENLFVRGMMSRDFFSYRFIGVIPTGTVYTAGSAGEYKEITSTTSETNSMLTLNYNDTFFENFGLSALVGGNIRNNSVNQTTIAGTQFIIPNFYSYTNLTTSNSTPYNPITKTNSVFGSLDLDYKNLVFLTFTGRQDWFSTLSPANNSIFYPSVGGSFVFSEAIRLPGWFSFGKVRASWAEVGGATPDAFATNPTYSMVAGGHNGRPLQQVTQVNLTNLVANSNLRPLTSTTFEVGFDLNFLRNRLGLDFTYYNRKTTDDIVKTRISPTTGYNDALLNIGELNNKGIELLISATPAILNHFKWNFSYNVAYNKSEVLQLSEGLNTIEMAASVGGWAFVHNSLNRPYGIVKGYKMQRNENGEIIYNTANGYPLKSDLVELGQGVAPLTMGFTNTFTYKNFSLDVLLDGKFGNKVFSTMDVYATRFGLHKNTLPGRDEGLAVRGVSPEGNAFEKTIPVSDLRLYYDNLKNYTELFVYDGSFVKLRQVIFNYNIPFEKFKIFNLQAASISFVARNLLTLYKKTDNFDPESGYTNGNAQGFEAFSIPRTRSYGVNLMVKF